MVARTMAMPVEESTEFSIMLTLPRGWLASPGMRAWTVAVDAFSA